MRGDAGVAHLEAGPAHELLGRPFERAAADQRADRDDRRVGRLSASLIPGTARIGPTLAIGFDGPITIASASAITRSTSGVTRALSTPRNSTPSSSGSDVLLDQVLLEVTPFALGADVRLDRLVAHRQHRRADAEGRREVARDLRQPPALVQELGAQQAGREVVVAELNQSGAPSSTSCSNVLWVSPSMP